jgi:hypothetical protein
MIIYLDPKIRTWKEKFNLIKQLIKGRRIKFKVVRQKNSSERWIIEREIN